MVVVWDRGVGRFGFLRVWRWRWEWWWWCGKQVVVVVVFRGWWWMWARGGCHVISVAGIKADFLVLVETGPRSEQYEGQGLDA